MKNNLNRAVLLLLNIMPAFGQTVTNNPPQVLINFFYMRFIRQTRMLYQLQNNILPFRIAPMSFLQLFATKE